MVFLFPPMYLESPLWNSAGSVLCSNSEAEVSLDADQAGIAAWGVFAVNAPWINLYMSSWYNYSYNVFTNWPVEVLYIFGVHLQLETNLSFSCYSVWNTGLFSSDTSEFPLISTNYCVSKSIIDHPSLKLVLLLMTVALSPLPLLLHCTFI